VGDKLLWLDLETTGLDPEKGQILEVGVVVTDGDLKVLERAEWVVHHDPVPAMDPWCLRTHTANGLLVECCDSGWKNVGEVESEILSMLRVRLGLESKNVRLAGSSIHFDRAWAHIHMPRLDAWLHHRMVDVLSLWEALRIARPDLPFPEKPAKTLHRVRQDIDDSIELLGKLLALVPQAVPMLPPSLALQPVVEAVKAFRPDLVTPRATIAVPVVLNGATVESVITGRRTPLAVVSRSERAVEVALPCGHRAMIRHEWVRHDGTFDGRLGCSVCRQVVEDAVIERPAAEAIRVEPATGEDSPI
jgi:oligoribonuclease